MSDAPPEHAKTPTVLHRRVRAKGGGPKWPAPGTPTPRPYPYADAPTFPASIGTQPAGMPLHACMGLNSCRGSDRYGTGGRPDTGEPNACAGQGYCSTAVAHTCHVQNSCRNQGGCGLYGTAEELDNPGRNACQSLGSCAVPINAERFSTNGPNQGKSVWARAREVFESEVWPDLRQELLANQAGGTLDPGQARIDPGQPLPATLGLPPATFAGTGPSYLWISDDNEQRGNMTACGASGLSGAGGCS
ncbi:MAG TPA: hypothetical protein VFW19_02485 [Allosphingosinicella sp.]|nr:hypothetical protein [Allosphingosinicella sp.]